MFVAMVFIFSVLLTNSTIAAKCRYPDESADDKSYQVEVYGMPKHIMVHNDPEEMATMDFRKNTLILPSGISCDFDRGEFNDTASGKSYTWSTDLCDHLTPFHIKQNMNNYEFQTMNEDPLIQFFVAENSTNKFVLPLVNKLLMCDKTVWDTEHKNIVVAIGENNFINNKNRNNTVADWPEESSYSLERNTHFSMMIMCELREQKYISRRLQEEISRLRDFLRYIQISQPREMTMTPPEFANFEQYSVGEAKIQESSTKTENDFCIHYMLSPNEYMICLAVSISYLLFSSLNIIMNYFSLRNLLGKDTRRCIVFYSMTQWLTIRCICENQKSIRINFDKWFIGLN